MILEKVIPTVQLRKICASFLALVILAIQLPITEAAANSLATGVDVLGNSTKAETSAHSVRFNTQTNLETGDKIQLHLPDFTLNLDSTVNVSVAVGPASTVSYSNSAKTITLTLTESFSAGGVKINVIGGKITNPATEGEYGVSILTMDASNGDDILDTGIAKAGIENHVHFTVHVIPVVTNVTSPKPDGSYWVKILIPIRVVFSGKVYVTGTPQISLNSGGTAYYVSGSGTNVLTFDYLIGDYQKTPDYIDLEYTARNALTLQGGAIEMANGKPAILTLPARFGINSLGYNKNIEVRRHFFAVSSPNFLNFEIIDQGGKTSDPTPPIKVEANNEADKVALSCDGGLHWTPWMSFPPNNVLNSGDHQDFDILRCGREDGLKTVTAKLANNDGYESAKRQDSTIFHRLPLPPPTTDDGGTTTGEDDQGEDEDGTQSSDDTGSGGGSSSYTVDVSAAVEEASIEPEKPKIIEIGYINKHRLWRSFRNVAIDDDGSATVEAEEDTEIEVRVIEAESLESYASSTSESSGGSGSGEDEGETAEEEEAEIELFIRRPILPASGGKIPVKIRLLTEEQESETEETDDEKSEAETENINDLIEQEESSGGGSSGSNVSGDVEIQVEIPAGTTVNDEEGNSYDGVIYAPQVLSDPPASKNEKIKIKEAIFVGSSSGDISFDQPVLLTLPIDSDIEDLQIYTYDEDEEDWIIAADAVSGETGGQLSEDGGTLEIWVDHMTIFGVAEINEIELLGIKRIAVGSDTENRASFTSGEWFSPADIGNDDLVSFAWSGSGEKFYYTLDDNSFPTSLSKISAETRYTTDFYLDKIRISEGESYFHILATSENSENSQEAIFIVDYDKTSPQLTEISAEETEDFVAGDEIDLTLTFSEEITTPDSLTVYFKSGEILEIPTIKSAAEEITTPLTIVKATSLEDLEIISVVGMLIDRAGLVAINPQPLSSNLTAGKIRNAKLTIFHPVQLVEGKYFTKKNSVTITPHAEGATQMRLAASILGAENEWVSYSSNEIEIPLENFGTQKILFEFTNELNEKQSVGTVITRLPADSEELIEMQKSQNKTLASLQTKISNQLKSLFSWGISTEHEEILIESNPAILPASEIPTAEEIAILNDVLEIAQKIRSEVTESEPSWRKIIKFSSQLKEHNFMLDDFLTLVEINSLLTKISDTETEILRGYFDPSTVSLSQIGEDTRAGKLSLGMRDSDNDGISDTLEIEIGSNPFLVDSDNDGKTDGEEWLDLDSDPLTADLPISSGFINLTEKIADPKPLLRGIANAGENLRIIAINENGENIPLGSTTADANGKWLMISEVVLGAGEYELKLKNESTELASRIIEIDLDFILLPPKIYTGKSEVFTKNKPAFFGNTFYGSRVIGIFESEISSTAVVTDNTLGDFVIRPPRELAVGDHTLTIYTELPDETRSPARVIEFEIVEEAKAAALKFEILSVRNVSITASVILVLIIGIVLRRKRSV
jgi:hypothetical protein